MNKPIKDLLNSSHSEEVRKQLRIHINSLNKEYKYGKHEEIDPEFAIRLLTYGYIEDDYETYIAKKDDSILSYDEQTFLLNVKKDIPNSRNLSLRKDHLDIIISKIQDYQWNSQSLLNNTIIDYILENDKTNRISIISKIVEAMYNFDRNQQPYDRFIPQYFKHCYQKNINTNSLLDAIEVVLSKLSSTKNAEEDYHEEIVISDSAFFLELFFKETSTSYFISFLNNIYNDIEIEYSEISANEISAINHFFNDEDNEIFKEEIFNNIGFFDLKNFEKIGISINLTQKILKKIINCGKLNSTIYDLNKKNIDLIFKEINIGTEESYYLTRCLQNSDLNERILKETNYYFQNILESFKIVEEDYSSLKNFFEANNRSKQTIVVWRKENYFKKMSPKWEKFVIYNRYASFDNYLSESIKEFILSNSSNQKISESLQKDETGIKEFIRAVIKNSNIDNNVLLQKFLPFWKEYIPVILNCYKGYEEELQGLSLDKNHLLQTYAIQNEKIYFDQIMFLLVTKDPDFFENKYPEEEFAKENEFQLMILESEEKNLDNLKKHFFKEIFICPTNEENPRRYKAYKKFGLVQKKPSLQNFLFLDDIVKSMHKVFEPIKNIDLKSFKNSTMHPALNISDNFDRLTPLTEDPWSILLFKTLKYWYQELCRYVAFNTFPYGNGIQGLKEIEQSDEKIVNERNRDYQNLVKKVDFWLNELDDYIKEFK